jgi:selenide,water dikinase
MNIMGCPVGDMPDEVFKQIVAGGLSKIKEAGALLVGGHTVEDKELKYGLSVTGIVHPDRIFLNSGAQPGDVLLLTKPLGTGILSTAVKGDLAGQHVEQDIVTVMAFLNKQPIECLTDSIRKGVHSVTDITGFGLLGHLHEVAAASQVALTVDSRAMPLLPGVIDFADMGIIPEGAYTNRNFYSKWVSSSLPEMDSLEIAGYDPQTSGGLLFAMTSQSAALLQKRLKEVGYPFDCPIIGKVTGDKQAGTIVLH